MARVAIIEPRSAGYTLVDRARQLGHDPLVLTFGKGDRAVPDIHLAHATHVELLDTNDDAAVLAAVRRLHAEAPLDAVLPGFEQYLPVAARAAAELGLCGLAPDTAAELHFKHRMRAALDAAGVDQPASRLVAEDGQVAAAVAAVGLPCVVKPVDQSGSLFVRRADSVDDARAALAGIRDPATEYLDRRTLPMALVEEYVHGPEFSIEGYVADGVVHVVCITEKVLGAEPYFVEVGHIVPADLAPESAEQIAEYVRRVAAVLRIEMGVFHAEVRLSSRGPLLMEIAGRLPGDRIPDLLVLARGVDLYAVMLRSYLGEPIPVESVPTGGARAGIRYFVRPDLRSYARMRVGERVAADPRVREIAALHPPGSALPDPGSSSGRLGFVVATGATYQETVAVLAEVDAAVSFT